MIKNAFSWIGKMHAAKHNGDDYEEDLLLGKDLKCLENPDFNLSFEF